jgi:hypothetical protein
MSRAPAAALCMLGLCIALGVSAQGAAKEVLDQTNAFRAAEGLSPLANRRELSEAAGEFAGFMARTGKYGHAADGRQPAQRAAAKGYDYCIVAENIARVYRPSGYDAASLAADMLEGWKNSPEHRKSMLDAAVIEIGVGIARGDDGRYFGVQMFGRPTSAAIRFTVSNRAGHEVQYRAGKRRFMLPPRAERTHTVCRPLTLAIDLAKPFRARPQGGEHFVVIERQGKLVMQ